MIKMIFKDRKGTEKPIEIFVALFVILAVALVMLKLFQNQITQKQDELQSFQQERKQAEFLESATLHCKQKCNQASNDRCSLQSLASLCVTYASDAIKSPDWLDLNNNGALDRDISTLAGIGICEDSVPCSTMISECCGQALTPKRCSDILTQYWKQQGFTKAQVESILDSQVTFGSSCGDPGDTDWYSIGNYASIPGEFT